MSVDTLTWVMLALLIGNLLIGLWFVVRRPPVDADGQANHQQLLGHIQAIGHRVERTESELRREMGDNARSARQE